MGALKKLLLVLVVLLCADETFSATYYMRADGSAANVAAATGPPDDASKCMGLAVHNAGSFAPGDIILLSSQGGPFYFTSFGTIITPPSSGSALGGYITYDKVPGETPSIDGSINAKSSGGWTSIGDGNWTATCSAVNINNLWLNYLPGYKTTGTPSAVGEYKQSTTTLTLHTGGDSAEYDPSVFFTSVRRGYNDSVFFISGREYIKVQNLTFQYQRTVTSVAYNKATLVIYDSSNIKILNNTFTDCNVAIWASTGDYITIDGNVFNKNYRYYGTSTYITDSVIRFSSDNTFVTNNTINPSANTYDGVGLPYSNVGISAHIIDYSINNGAKSLYIARNNITKTYRYGINVSGYDAANCTAGCYNGGTIEYNTLIDGYRSGTVAADDDGLSCGDALIAPSWNYGLTFRYNTVTQYGNSGGQSTNSWLDVTWYANSFVSCGCQGRGYGGVRALANHKVINNTIYDTYGNAITVSGAAEVKNNIIHTTKKWTTDGSNGNAIHSYTATIEGANNLTYLSENLNTYQFTNTNGLTSNPLFISADDFRLQPSSPAVKAGVFVTGVHDQSGCTDLAGIPCNSMSIPIGAYSTATAQQTYRGPRH